ncbi:MAG: hypothetical protein KKC99_13120 [Proteobacteria bacterium]|nr:hypothetical protein [Pseudomonadota bacterium]
MRMQAADVPAVRWIGIERDGGRVERGRSRSQDVELIHGDIAEVIAARAVPFDASSLILINPRRLLEMDHVTRGAVVVALRQGGSCVLFYSYDQLTDDAVSLQAVEGGVGDLLASGTAIAVSVSAREVC